MRTLVLLLGMSTALLGGACVYLLSRVDRAATAASASATGSNEARIQTLLTEREQLRSEIRLARSEAPCPEATKAEPRSVRTDAAAAGSPALAVAARIAPNWLDRLSPEHRHTMARQRYGSLFRELALSDAQVDALLPLLAEEPQKPGAFGEDFGRDDTPEGRAREQKIAAVLGTEKAAEFAELRHGMPARSEIQRVRALLDSSGEPVDDEQQRRLLARLKEVELPPPPELTASGPPQTTMQQIRNWREERAKHVREAAAAVLTPRQLERLDESEALLAAMQASVPDAPPPSTPAAPPAKR